MKASTNINFKKLLLFIVEGSSDKISLENILKKIIKNKKIHFEIVFGDVLSDDKTSIKNVETKIDARIKNFLSRNRGFKRSDIVEIIHITDSDGIFIPKNNIKSNSNVRVKYNVSSIEAKDVKSIIKRNCNKSTIINKLISTTKIGTTDYSIYYFSTNLEHVLHNNANLDSQDKAKYAYAFSEKYLGREHEFETFLKNEGVINNSDYQNSWKYLQQSLNSLNRLTNVNILIDKYK